MNNLPILSILIFLPIIGGAFISLIKSTTLKKYVSLFVSFVSLVFSGILLFHFDYSSEIVQFTEKIVLVKSFNINYFLGIDGLSLILILLTNLLIFLIILYSENKKDLYYSLFLVLQGVTVGLFCTLDSLIFYILLETSLVVMFFIIMLWGGEDKIKALFKYCMYSLIAGVFLLVAILYIHFDIASFNLLDWQVLVPQSFSVEERKWLFWLFVIAFAIKIPMFGVHFWLPQAHSQAPTGGSVFLSGILLKVGVYGIIRFVLPIFPDMIELYSPALMGVGLFGVIYASLLAIYEKEDIKKVIAYSSIAHMGFIMITLFSLNELAIQGAIMQMVSHALLAAGLFFVVGIVHDRLGSKNPKDMISLQRHMPKLAILFMILFLDGTGLPITAGFVGKLTSILGIYYSSTIVTAIALVGVVLTVVYMLRFYNVVFCSNNESTKKIEDLNIKELLVLSPIVVLLVLLGFKSDLVFNLTSITTNLILNMN
ncbi:MAG: NADH-quinone oxidoreductase subunit M [Proteobacteria bacterium]|nr:NADH-quinone oxidoreductase subunit M [Pseudomonadota bacterium]